MSVLCKPDDAYLLFFEKEFLFSSEDPPSKENPYEDIELERSCLQNKCVSPSSSSPVPDTTKVTCSCRTVALLSSVKQCQNSPSNNPFSSISSPLSLASSDKLQIGEASNCWSYGRSTRTLVSPLLPVPAPPPHPAAQMIPPVFLETHTIADGRKSQRYGILKSPLQSLHFFVSD